MDQLTCIDEKNKNWPKGLLPDAVKNICTQCIDKKGCNQPFKRTWDEE